MRQHLFPETFSEPQAERPEATQERSVERLIDHLVEGFGKEGQPPLLPTLERLLIARALELCRGNQVKAAGVLGISRNTLRNRIERFGLKYRVAVKVDPGDQD